MSILDRIKEKADAIQSAVYEKVHLFVGREAAGEIIESVKSSGVYPDEMERLEGWMLFGLEVHYDGSSGCRGDFYLTLRVDV